MDGDNGGRRRRAIAAAAVGNVLEWYDFIVYSFLATVIAKTFFPLADQRVSLLATFATFGIGFVARPLGALIIGWIGDRKGRKTALLTTMLIMAVATFAIGLIPSHTTIGVFAPALLVCARLAQGFSSGGEWGSSATFMAEWADPKRRGFFTSLQQSTVVAGLLLGSGIAALLVTLLGETAMEEWGWRLPFLLGGALAPVGLYIRSTIDETPMFEGARAWRATNVTPLQFVQAFGVMIASAVQFFVFLAYMPTFAETEAGLDKALALWANSAGLLLLMLAIPIFGLLSDRIGRKPLLLASCIFFIVLSYPLIRFMISQASFASLLFVQFAVALAIASYSAALPAALTEIFPTRVRTIWVSVANGSAVAIFGGFAPFVSTWLIGVTEWSTSPVFLVMAGAVLSAIAVLSLPETAHVDLP